MQDFGIVSIITPAYNTGRYIEETIRSVLSQTYQNWEMLIVDDGSAEPLSTVIAPFLTNPKIRYIPMPQHLGAAQARNLALREAKGRWIAFLDSDDVWLPEKLEKQLTFMADHNCHFSYTNYEMIDENSHPLGIRISGPKRIRQTQMYRCCWPGCLTVMYDREVIGLLQIAPVKGSDDYAMWLQICKKAPCLLLDEELAKYRRRRNSLSDVSYTVRTLWIYSLFRLCENLGILTSGFLTMRFLFWSVYKKLRYVKKQRRTRCQNFRYYAPAFIRMGLIKSVK